MLGEFGVGYVLPASPKVNITGQMVNKMSRWSTGEPKVSGVQYDLGLTYQAHPKILLEVRHGSWHNVDSQAPTESYNRLGIEVKLP